MTKSATLPPFSPSLLLGLLSSPVPISLQNLFYEKIAQHLIAHTNDINSMLSTLSGQSILITPSDLPTDILITISSQHLAIEAQPKNATSATTTIYGNYHSLINFFDNVILAENDTQQEVPFNITLEGNEQTLITFLRCINKTSAELTEEIFDGLGLSGVMLEHYLRPKKYIFDTIHQQMQQFQHAFTAPMQDRSEEQEERITQLTEKVQKLEKIIKKQAKHIDELRQSKK